MEDELERRCDRLKELLEPAKDIYGTTVTDPKTGTIYPQGYLFVEIAQEALELYDLATKITKED